VSRHAGVIGQRTDDQTAEWTILKHNASAAVVDGGMKDLDGAVGRICRFIKKRHILKMTDFENLTQNIMCHVMKSKLGSNFITTYNQ